MAYVVDFVFCAFSENVELSAHAVTFEDSATSSLEFGDLEPGSRVAFLGEASNWRWEMALVTRTYDRGNDSSN